MNESTLLLRQVHPSWVQGGRVTSQAFRPTPKDKSKLSVYDGDQISGPAAFVHYTESLGFLSVGVLAVTVAECTELALDAVPDPEPFPEHSVIDFTGLSSRETEKRGKKLRAKAVDRDWIFHKEAQ